MNTRTALAALCGALGVLAAVPLAARPARADILDGFHESQVMRQRIAGHLEKTQFDTPALGGKRNAYVYTPPGFATDPNKRYPVLILLHGSPGGPLDWLWQGNAHTTVDKAIASGVLPPCLVVLPDGHGPFVKGGSEWADAVNGKCDMETAVCRDLVNFMKARYRASADPALWAVGGLSEGGYGAANLTVRHPDRFRAALVLSGDLRVSESWGDDRDVFGTDPGVRSANSPIEAVRRLPAQERQKLHFYVAVGADDDQDLINDAVGFTGIARAAGATVQLARDPGDHKWGFWKSHFAQSLPLLGGWWKQAGAAG
jgi:enterochelin esterase-like enzyme